MADWRDDIDKGLELIKPATGPRDEPWQGAANFKTPILMEARVKFGDRASEELLGTGDLVSAKVVGEDPQGQKGDRIERVEGVMNWQLTVESDSWVEEHDKLLYNLSCQGSIFKKTYFDPSVGHNVSDVIMYPNFAVNQASKTLDTAPRFTHRIFKFPRQIMELKRPAFGCRVLASSMAPKQTMMMSKKPKMISAQNFTSSKLIWISMVMATTSHTS